LLQGEAQFAGEQFQHLAAQAVHVVSLLALRAGPSEKRNCPEPSVAPQFLSFSDTFWGILSGGGRSEGGRELWGKTCRVAHNRDGRFALREHGPRRSVRPATRSATENSEPRCRHGAALEAIREAAHGSGNGPRQGIEQPCGSSLAPARLQRRPAQPHVLVVL